MKNTRSLSLNHPEQGNSREIFSSPADEIFIVQQLQQEKVFCIFCIPNIYFPWHRLRGQQNYQAVRRSQESIIYRSALRDTGPLCCTVLGVKFGSGNLISHCFKESNVLLLPSSSAALGCCPQSSPGGCR